jgi:hypothetical protein
MTLTDIEQHRMNFLLRYLKNHSIRERVLNADDEKLVDRWYTVMENPETTEKKREEMDNLIKLALRNPHGEQVVTPTHAMYMEWTEGNDNTPYCSVTLLYDTPVYNVLKKPVAENIFQEIQRVSQYFGFEFNQKGQMRFTPGYSCSEYLEDGSMELENYPHILV